MTEYHGKRVAVAEKKERFGIERKQLRSMLLYFLCAGIAVGYVLTHEPAVQQAEQPAAEQEIVPPPEVPEEPEVTMETLRAATFTDVPEESAFRDAVGYVEYYDLLRGEQGCFGVYEPTKRGDVASAIYRLSGAAAPESGTVYSDVPPESEYADAAVWCTEHYLITAAEGQFAPDEPVSRAELATSLYRFAVREGIAGVSAGDLSAYQDGEQVETGARSGMAWALENGIFRGCVADVIRPDAAVSRGQLAQALVSYEALREENALAEEISQAVPARSSESAARDNHAEIQAAVDAAAQKYGAAGVQVAVIENGEVTDTYAYGWATKNEDPMTANHRMRVASISKVMIGVTAMLLREDGIVDLDQDISAYWDCEVKNPKYPNKPITLRNMLSHTSSIINGGDDMSRAYASVRSRLQSGGYSGAVPGDIGYWSYNNYAFGVLGMTLELAADRTVDEILREKLYTTMGIDAAYYAGDIENTDMLATLYRNTGEVSRSVAAQKNLHADPTPGANGTSFAGGLTISASDLGKLIALLAADGRYEGLQLLSEESVELMETRYEQPVPGGSYQALPLRYWPELYGRNGIYYHTGSAYGVFNCASYDPETGDGVVVLTIGASGAKDDYGIYKVCAAINDYVYGVIQ